MSASGWTLVAKSNQDIIDGKSRDYSVSAADGGTNGVWGINDNNSPSNAYMHMVRDPNLDDGSGAGETGLSASTGLIMARIKAISGTNTAGTFGYTVGFGSNNISGAIGVRAGAVKFADVPGSSSTLGNYSTDTTSNYRVYALVYSAGGAFTAYISNGSNASPNAADWTTMGSGTISGIAALTDHNGVKQTGLVVGSFGTSGNASNVNLDWLYWTKNDLGSVSGLQPWDDYVVPEPATLALLVAGVPLVMRRRRQMT